MTSLNEIRTHFLDYFNRNDHQVVQSSPLVPRNDATLLFVNSGMVQFKNLFTGIEKRDYVRACTSQKCIRAGGKHNDLDNVGYTARHHTFFEMLGNFSFGDYFKERAIYYTWDLLTRGYDIPADRLLCTVYHDDDEAAGYWKKIAGFSDDKIIKISSSDNFWSMGNTGPCGPCSEIFFDYGEDIPGGPPGSPDEDGDRFVEIWNLVFMQYNKDDSGQMNPLPRPCIDTGMGLERIGALLQGTRDNYCTDLFTRLIEESAKKTGTDPFSDKNVHHRVIADHLRSTAFLIAEGVLPAKEGRGYVLRRIMRRAIRHAHFLGYEGALLHELFPLLVQLMGDAFPELVQNQDIVSETIRGEEKRFKETLARGLEILNKEAGDLAAGDQLSGPVAFKLYDTYGFPLDLTQDVLRERDITVDVSEFESEMSKQKIKARASWSGSGEAAESEIWFKIQEQHGSTEFLGYEYAHSQAVILALTDGKVELQEASTDSEIIVVTNQTPFYAEAGGQVGDTGTINTSTGRLKVTDTQKHVGVYAHHCKVLKGYVRVNDDADLRVDDTRRQKIKQNHSATHLLNEALRRCLGSHVVQKGSLNDANRLRFDFAHSQPLNLEELAKVEETVNQKIFENAPVKISIMGLEEALGTGAQAMFGEKYDDEVRVVSMGYEDMNGESINTDAFSKELCGGIHVNSTSEIGLFVVTGESSIASGIRRVEALTGKRALDYLRTMDQLMAETSLKLKVPPKEIPHTVAALLKEKNQLRKELEAMRREKFSAPANEEKGLQFQKNFTWGQLIGRIIKGLPPAEISGIIDNEKVRVMSGIILLVSEFEGKASIAVGVTDNLTDRFSAIDITKRLVPIVEGKGGGGRPDFARGGGPNATHLDKVLVTAKELFKEES